MTPDSTPASGATPSIEIRDLLFGDLPMELWPADESVTGYPWSAFIEARNLVAAGDTEGAIQKWSDIASSPNLEIRHYLQAWLYLREHGVKPEKEIAKHVLGVVIEVALPDGVDLLAAYYDHHARYYNFSGKAIIWEHPDDSLDPLIDRLLATSQVVTDQIGPTAGKRPPIVVGDEMRMNFLTPSGLHFGEGFQEPFSQDPLAAPILHAAVKLMQALMDKTKPA